MSLVRLLTAGKSLVGIKESASRYQMRSRHLLPTFGSGKNPFAAPEAPEPEPEPAVSAAAAPTAAPAPQPARYQMSTAELAAARLKETKKLPAAPLIAAEVKPAPAKVSPVAQALDWLKGCGQKLKSLRRPVLRKSKPASPFRAARPEKAAVQGELSLNHIKVVRNDLSEADVEIVQTRAAAKAKPRPAETSAEQAELAETQAR